MLISQQPPIINIMEKAAKKAGKKLIRDFGELENLQVSSKSLGNFVTSSDLNTEKIIKDVLQYHFPDYGLIMEESDNIIGKDKDNSFIVDPIDGTSNFIHGIPHFCIVIAKLSFGNISDGIIFNPITDEFFWASKGKGSWLNNQRLRVSNRNKLHECIIGTGKLSFNGKNVSNINQIDNIAKKSSSLRQMGSAALDLAFVASGKFDGYWQNNLNLWDIASGILLVVEAGGKISEPDGKDWQIASNNVLASNTFIHEKLIESLN